MQHHDTPREEPAEHLRFAAHLRALERVSDADEADLVGEVLADPDRTMAQSAVLRHLDRRAADLHHEPAYEPWAASMTRATLHHPFLTRRLREWSLLRALTLGQRWHQDALLDSSDWLQHRAATGSNTGALEVLADRGRTQRIRATARTTLEQQRRSRRAAPRRTVP
ncbi:hypothetical protein KV205_26885 [Streptomyces sp. SKN60]|uniref:hypothetical protein n=1 Tax=Streptomyces sp. SKN60 TaxID=2855506 RepID=UPI002245EC71|nr:hypothetical protein [Streptomyces sp. SKN60]MCX2184129.1 hypothetical protein [Streptomyces sp. SKN60]